MPSQSTKLELYEELVGRFVSGVKNVGGTKMSFV